MTQAVLTLNMEAIPMRHGVVTMLVAMALLLATSICEAQYHPPDSNARKQIDEANQQWVDAMKSGNAALLGPGNAEDAVDCDPTGNCIRGRGALDKRAKEEMSKSGKADSASVNSVGWIQQGRYVYEWGEATAHFANGHQIVDRYLTVWQQQADGMWKLFRNLVMPSN
jgi:ketosteroid isomerase-like protein